MTDKETVWEINGTTGVIELLSLKTDETVSIEVFVPTILYSLVLVLVNFLMVRLLLCQDIQDNSHISQIFHPINQIKIPHLTPISSILWTAHDVTSESD